MGNRLEGRIAVVTGSDSGMGHAMAVQFAKEGADIVVSYFKGREGAENTRCEVEAQGCGAIVVQVDQREPGSVANLFRETQETAILILAIAR